MLRSVPVPAELRPPVAVGALAFVFEAPLFARTEAAGCAAVGCVAAGCVAAGCVAAGCVAGY